MKKRGKNSTKKCLAKVINTICWKTKNNEVKNTIQNIVNRIYEEQEPVTILSVAEEVSGVLEDRLGAEEKEEIKEEIVKLDNIVQKELENYQ